VVKALARQDAAQVEDTAVLVQDTATLVQDTAILVQDVAVADSGPTPGTLGCQAFPGAPAGLAPLPNPGQAEFQHQEMSGFIHFGLETFDGTEQGDPSKDVPALFNPTNLDARQWVRVFKEAGFRQVTLTVKHGTGFCLWPSLHTGYSVQNSPWKNGQGDVVRDFTEAAHQAGMRVGFYLTPLDQNYPSSADKYEPYFRNLLTELLTNYGEVNEIEFDGYSAPKTLDWKAIVQLAKDLQPGVLVWMGPEIAVDTADIRWIRNQTGDSSRTQSSLGDVNKGDPMSTWYPSDAPVTVRASASPPPKWFWHPTDSLISLKSLQTIYFKTVGMNASLRLNVPPSTSGQIPDDEVTLLAEFGSWLASLYKNNLAKGAPVTASSTWSAAGFGPERAIDDNGCSYWAAAKGETAGRLEITPSAPITFSLISIREPIELGERTTAYHVEIKQNGSWNKAPLDASGTQIQGTIIGQRQLWQLNATTAEAVALVIDSARSVPAVAEFGLFQP
jgi:alpha-L-fucosidase